MMCLLSSFSDRIRLACWWETEKREEMFGHHLLLLLTLHVAGTLTDSGLKGIFK